MKRKSTIKTLLGRHLGLFPNKDGIWLECDLCGDCMPSDPAGNSDCRCGNLFVDVDSGRFSVSKPGKVNVLVE